MSIYYGLTTQLDWVKIRGALDSAEDFVIVLDQDNFKKLTYQANQILENIDKESL